MRTQAVPLRARDRVRAVAAAGVGMGEVVKAWQQIDTHAALWLLIAFALGTLWVPAVELIADQYIVDNEVKP